MAVLLYNIGTADIQKRGEGMTERGRPKSDNPKSRRITVKVTESEFSRVEEVATKKGLTKSEAMLRGIELLDAEK